MSINSVHPFFSIVTVTYNDCANLINTCKSVMAQTCSDFEWIVIDGFSSDETKPFLESLQMSNFSYLIEKDEGLYDAMNKGVKRSNGRYLIFLNSGDVFSSDNLLENVQMLINKEVDNVDFVYGDSQEISTEGKIFYKKSRSISWKKFGMFTHHQAMFYKREILIEKGIEYNQAFSIAGDYDFTLHFLQYAHGTLYIPVSICTFLQGGLSHKNWRRGIAQANLIRQKYLRLNKSNLVTIYLLQNVLHFVRFKLTPVYNFYRFSKKHSLKNSVSLVKTA